MVFGFPQGSLMCGGCIQFWVSGNEKKPLFFLNILKNRGGGVGVDVRVLALGSGGAKSLYGRFPHTGTYFFPLRALKIVNTTFLQRKIKINIKSNAVYFEPISIMIYKNTQ